MSIEDLWYKNAIIYCLDVDKYMDANGDGVGDFEGLSRRLDYLHGLGVTCVWLQPFYRSPNRDNGYDVSDYYAVDPRYGSAGDFVEFMNHAQAIGMRVIVDLVVSHTSIDHPWFQSARSSPDSPYRDWYVWADKRPADHDEGMVFPGYQHTTWTRDRKAGQYYFHRFYPHQADLNTHNPAVREEIYKIMGYWLQLGVSGFRMDAVPFLIERKGAGVEPVKDYALLQEMREFLQWRRRDAILLAEANVPPRESLEYFGDEGDRLQMMLNFPVNQRLFYALASGDCGPLRWAIEETLRDAPENAQWVQFLRSHDELDLGRLSATERERVFKVFAPKKNMRLYRRGIRRRLAPMLGNDRKRLELAYSLLFALPGTPMMQYGEEIGMGDDLTLPEREATRTPMQWSDQERGGFSRADKTVSPVVDDDVYGYRKVNVARQRCDRDSLLQWTAHIIRTRRECPEISWGRCSVIDLGDDGTLALRYDFRDTTLVTLHNFSQRKASVRLTLEGTGSDLLVDLFTGETHRAKSGHHTIVLPGYGYRWLRLGGADNTLERAAF
jgi:maltose alpha-D-glucosyltransferase/alpha-amylase